MTDVNNPRTETAYHRPESPEALEREVAAERGRVAETLDALQEKMSVGNIIDDAVRSFSRYGGDIAGSLGRQVRNNPLPLLLTGVGLAWLMTSSGRERSRYREDEYLWDVDDDLYDEEFAGTRRYGTNPVRPYGTAGVAGTYEEHGSSGGSSVKDTAGAAARSAGRAAGSAGSGISHAAGSAAAGASHATGSAASGISQAAGSAARGVGRAVGAVGSAVGSAASAFSSGTRGASHGARHAGESVRDGAYRAQSGAYELGRSSVRRLDEMIHEHPLVMGALALAVGAAIGGALPRTRTEDEYLGEYSESARQAARTAVERESEKARRVAGAVADEARHIAREKYEEVDQQLSEAAKEGRAMAERGKSEAASAAERLRDTARSEAERQNLGDPNKPA